MVHSPFDIKNSLGSGVFNNIPLHSNNGFAGFLTTETLV